jgi:cell division protein FtsW (lipid II flippase)
MTGAASTVRATERPSRRAVAFALGLDILLVIAFAAVGRASHDSDVWTGLGQTAWPFLAGIAAGWLVTRAWRAPAAPVRTGLGVWAVTVAGGMLLRAASGQGTAFAFIVVAAVTLLIALVGWRVIAAVVRRARLR